MGSIVDFKQGKGPELTETEIELLVETLGGNVNEDIQNLRDLKSNQGIETNPIPLFDRQPVTEVEANVLVDNRTGEFKLMDMSGVRADADVSLSDIVGEQTFDLNKVEITRDMVKTQIGAQYNNGNDMSDEDSEQLFEVMMRFKKGEKFNVYNALPEAIKRPINKMAMEEGSNSSKNDIAKLVVGQFMSDLQIDKAFIEFNDAIQKELKLMNFTEMYSEHRLEVMEVKLLESADKIEAESPEKAEMLRDISRVFTDTYMMGTMKNALNNRKNRQFIRDTSKYNKLCSNFNLKYENSKFKINNVMLLFGILDRKLIDHPEITNEDIMRFIMLFCKECDMKDSNNILDHTFMYYTIQNILMLDYVNNTEESNDFTKQLLGNIVDVIMLIRERV